MRPSVRERLRYRFDTTMSRGAIALVAYLAAAAAVLVVVGAALYALLVGGDQSFGERMWEALGRAFDPGTFTGDTGWTFRIVSLIITLGGLFLVSALIGLIATALDQRLEELRKGRSRVIETGHTLVLGWSPSLPLVLSELASANANLRDAAVVVLSRRDKVEMEDLLRDRIPAGNPTRLVCRTGDPADPADLALVDPLGARSVIVMCDPESGGDAQTVKAVLALMSIDPDLSRLSVVAELSEARHAEALAAVTRDRLRTIIGTDLIARVTAEVCFQSGLAEVVQELLDFDGDEIYFAAFAELVGLSYADAQLAFERSTLLGILRADGTMSLNPPADTAIAAGDELIGIASDDSAFVPRGVRRPPRTLQPSPAGAASADRRMVLVGWSSLGPRVVRELDEFLGTETVLEIVLDPDVVDVEEVRGAIAVHNIAVEITTHTGGPEEVALHAARRAFHEVIVLGRREGVDKEEADARTLLTLLAFGQVVRAHQLGAVRIVAELLEQRHAPLAQATGADDFIVSDELTSLMMAQLSERHELDRLFRDLFDRDGCTIELVDVGRYGAEQATDFNEVVASASAQGHTALGYRRSADASVVVNPPKSARLSLAEGDCVVVLR